MCSIISLKYGVLLEICKTRSPIEKWVEFTWTVDKKRHEKNTQNLIHNKNRLKLQCNTISLK